MPVYPTPVPNSLKAVIFSATDVNMKIQGNTSLGITDTGTFYPLMCIYIAKTVSGFTLPGTINLGTNSANYNNMATTLLTGVSSLNKMLRQDLATSAIGDIDPGTEIFVRVASIATVTSMTMDVHLVGYYM